jgi:hypothetical protein
MWLIGLAGLREMHLKPRPTGAFHGDCSALPRRTAK